MYIVNVSVHICVEVHSMLTHMCVETRGLRWMFFFDHSLPLALETDSLPESQAHLFN